MRNMSTEKLYLEDSYARTARSRILSCTPLANGNFAAVLDRTIFYPESGGQTADNGFLENHEVLDLIEDENGAIRHIISSALIKETVECRIDWDRRFDHMQQHSGQHLLSRSFIEVCAAPTVSFHMGKDHCTIDLDKESISDDNLEKVETLANSIIWQNRKITVRCVSPDDCNDQDIRKPPPGNVAIVRLVGIEDFDECPCCGTHINYTGELGLVKILKIERIRKSLRVHFKCGQRTLRDYAGKHKLVNLLINKFTTSADALGEKIDKLALENKSLKKTIKKINERLLPKDKNDLLAEAPVRNGMKCIFKIIPDRDSGYLRSLALSFRNDKKTVVVLASPDGRVVCNASKDIGVNLADYLVAGAESLGGSGGGSGVFASVALPESQNLSRLLEEVLKNVIENS